jgi:hypothetical protein
MSFHEDGGNQGIFVYSIQHCIPAPLEGTDRLTSNDIPSMLSLSSLQDANSGHCWNLELKMKLDGLEFIE